MPILSDAGGTPYASEEPYFPTTELQNLPAPPYSFYFHPPADFRQHFHFDDCREYLAQENSFEFDTVNFSRQSMYYHRLFEHDIPRLGSLYYLCPWLIVPVERKASTSYIPRIATYKLTVQPFSTLEKLLKGRLKRRITRRNAAAARKLELHSPTGSIHATWDSPGRTDLQNIPEMQCLTAQPVTITIDPGTAPFGYSSYVELRSVAPDATYDVVGRLYLAFYEMVERQAIFLEGSPPVGSSTAGTTTLNIRMLSQTEASTLLADLNRSMEMIGIKYTYFGPAIKMKDTSVLSPPAPITLSLPVAIKHDDPNHPALVTSTFMSAIEKVASIPFSMVPAQLFVVELRFFNISKTEVVGDQIRTIVTKGSSGILSRIARIMDNVPKAVAHEAAHALGLPHWFRDAEKTSAADITTAAADTAALIGLLTTADLCAFHDDANAGGLVQALAKRPGAPTAPRDRARMLYALHLPRIYYQCKTDNLMDYQERNQPPSQEQLRKHQIEQIRCLEEAP